MAEENAGFYHWLSRALANYGLGHIMVCAESVEEARIVAKKQVMDWIQDNYGGVYEPEDLEAKLAEIEKDMEKEPTRLRFLLIAGSE